jgi:hypothetical protein
LRPAGEGHWISRPAVSTWLSRCRQRPANWKEVTNAPAFSSEVSWSVPVGRIDANGQRGLFATIWSRDMDRCLGLRGACADRMDSTLSAGIRETASCETCVSLRERSGDVAQLVRALPCHGRGRGFEPRRPRHKPIRMRGLWRQKKNLANPRVLKGVDLEHPFLLERFVDARVVNRGQAIPDLGSQNNGAGGL